MATDKPYNTTRSRSRRKRQEEKDGKSFDTEFPKTLAGETMANTANVAHRHTQEIAQIKEALSNIRGVGLDVHGDVQSGLVFKVATSGPAAAVGGTDTTIAENLGDGTTMLVEGSNVQAYSLVAGSMLSLSQDTSAGTVTISYTGTDPDDYILTVQKDASNVTTPATTINFTGDGVTVNDAGGGTATVDIPGGTYDDTPLVRFDVFDSGVFKQYDIPALLVP